MGSCFSKKGTDSSSLIPLPDPLKSAQISSKIELENPKSDEKVPRKEIFVIKHRKSSHCSSEDEESAVVKAPGISEADSSTVCTDVTNCGFENGVGVVTRAPVRTSSCSKEEVDAILIQCGRLSRSSSMGKVGSGESSGTPQRGKKYSGSKRSYYFDNESRENQYDDGVVDDNDEAVPERIHRHRQRHRHARAATSTSPHERRRTPSREGDQQQRSNSARRRISVSPGRRSESPKRSSSSAAAAAAPQDRRPEKMISVPATVSSLVVEKSNNAGGALEISQVCGVKRIQVKRNTGESTVASRTAESRRSRSPARAKSPAGVNSPARTNIKNSLENQPLSLSRSNSRKAEHSPYRRNPLGKIDSNSNRAAGFESNEVQMKKSVTLMMEETKENPPPVSVSLTENPESQLSRTRSARKSRDLDMNLESLLNPNPSYTTLLLEDIQNFHQKKHNRTPSFSLPPCLTKACSILEAVADLTEENSSTKVKEQVKSSSKDPIMHPSFHKYSTVRRVPDADELESSGSNSYICGNLNNLLPSWESNSADSADCYAGSKSNIKEDNADKKRESIRA